MKTWLRRLGAGFLVLLLGVLTLLYALPGTTAGSQWLLARVPGLTVDNFRGRLLGDWQADGLSWQDPATSLQISDLQLGFDPGCLTDRRICISQLLVGRVELKTLAPSQPSSGPLELPDLQLPVTAVIERLQLGELLIDGQSLLRELQLHAELAQDGLKISDLTLGGSPLPDWEAGISQLQLGLQGDWPLTASVQLHGVDPLDAGAWPVEVSLSGSLKQQLQLDIRSAGWLSGSIQASLSPLAEQLPLQLQAQLSIGQLPATVPASLQPGALQLSLAGDLRQGFQLQASSQLGGSGGMPLAVQALLSASGLQLDQLLLADGTGGELKASGRVGWDGPLSAEFDLSSGAFAWQRLHPAIPPELTLQGLRLQSGLDGEDYQGRLQVRLGTPAGDGRLDLPFSGNFQQLQLQDFSWKQGGSALAGQAGVQFDSLAWQAELQATDFNPAPWVSELPGRIRGSLQASGTGQTASAGWKLEGVLRQQKLLASGQLDWAGERLDVPQLELQLGANRIAGTARLDHQLAADVDIDMPRLDQFWPGLRGRLDGSLLLAGSPAAPEGELRLRGNTSYTGLEVGQIDLAASLGAGQQGSLQLTASKLRLQQQRWDRIELTASGDPAAHRAAVDASGHAGERVQIQASGGMRGDQWQGSLQDGRIALAGFDWRQLEAASLQYQSSGSLLLGAHCWAMEQARLCAGQQQLAPVQKLDIKLSGLALDRLGELPDGVSVHGEINAAVKLVVGADGPRGELWLDAGSGSLQLPSGEENTPLPLDWKRARLHSQLQPRQVVSKLELAGPQLGEMQLQLQIDPASEAIAGDYRFDALQLALLRPLLPEGMALNGALGGQGRLAGNLQAPRVNGKVELSAGQVSGDALPLSIEDLQLALDIRGEQAGIAGHWRSGEQGQGQISGSLQWLPQPAVDLRIKGSRLPARVEPYADLDVEPDLRLRLQDGRLRLSGEVAVPRGSIEVQQLPASAVGLSPDARIAGEEPASGDLPFAMDLRLRIGEERLSFKGFGLSALLRGNLQVSDNLQTRGSLQLDDGRFKAYGQDLSLRRAQILFAGSLERPQLDIEAIRSFEDENLVTGLRLSGPADQPQTEVFSEPDMSQEETLSWLVLGHAPGDSSDDQNMLSNAALALGLSSGAPLASGVADRLGIRDFQLESSGSGLNTSVVATGNLTDRLSLRYGVGVFEPSNTLTLRYELSKRLYLEAASGVASSLDIFYKKDY